MAASGNTLSSITGLASNLANQGFQSYLGNLQTQQATGLSAQNSVSNLNQQQAANQTANGTAQAGLMTNLGSNLAGIDTNAATAVSGLQGNLGSYLAQNANNLGSNLSTVQGNLGTQQARPQHGPGIGAVERSWDERCEPGGRRQQSWVTAGQHFGAERRGNRATSCRTSAVRRRPSTRTSDRSSRTR